MAIGQGERQAALTQVTLSSRHEIFTHVYGSERMDRGKEEKMKIAQGSEITRASAYPSKVRILFSADSASSLPR